MAHGLSCPRINTEQKLSNYLTISAYFYTIKALKIAVRRGLQAVSTLMSDSTLFLGLIRRASCRLRNFCHAQYFHFIFSAMLLTDPAIELADARKHLVAPYKIWDWVAAADSEPCFIVSTRYPPDRKAIFTTAFITSVKRLIEYAGAYEGHSYQVYLLQKDLDAEGRQNLRFEEILGVGIYQDLPAGITYFAHLGSDGSYRQTYDAQPALKHSNQVKLVASFASALFHK